MKRTRTILLFIIIISLISGCNTNSMLNKKQTDPIRKQAFILNTIVTITLYDSEDETIIDKCFQVCREYEELLSRTITTSEVYKLGQSGTKGLDLSPQTLELLKAGLDYSELSKGAFDITISPLSELWDFTSESPSVPSPEAIEEAVSFVDYHNVKIDGSHVSFEQEGMGIDLGAIAKGYIADRIKDVLTEEGVKSAIINLGGNDVCVGNKPDGSPFKVGIQYPFNARQDIIAILEITDKSVVTSGVYERYFEQDGKLYHHILNPKNGYPYETNLLSVTIISEKSIDGDALSTTTFALGLDEGLKLINSLEGIYAVFITDDYKLHYSDGFHDAITVTEQE